MAPLALQEKKKLTTVQQTALLWLKKCMGRMRKTWSLAILLRDWLSP